MIIASKSIKRFGFKTAADSDVRLTLYWNDIILQCITYPVENDKYYGCDES